VTRVGYLESMFAGIEGNFCGRKARAGRSAYQVWWRNFDKLAACNARK
jgi:hypothetical protein